MYQVAQRIYVSVVQYIVQLKKIMRYFQDCIWYSKSRNEAIQSLLLNSLYTLLLNSLYQNFELFCQSKESKIFWLLYILNPILNSHLICFIV